MGSYKVVIFSQPDNEGSHMFKEIFRDKFKLSSGNDEKLAFDYILHKVDPISVNWKLYLVSDIDKFEEICPLYFTNVDVYIVVFDFDKLDQSVERYFQDFKVHESRSKIAYVRYHKNYNNSLYTAKCNTKDWEQRRMYFEFFDRTDLESIIIDLFENECGLKAEITRLLEQLS